jgi:hypothetical protein
MRQQGRKPTLLAHQSALLHGIAGSIKKISVGASSAILGRASHACPEYGLELGHRYGWQ